MTTVAPGTSEYDRFGPWIDEVGTPDDVPRLFREHPLDLDRARLVLKVPRAIARRDATPDMDLYDHLLVLEQDALTVLSRRVAPPGRRGRAEAPTGYDVVRVPLDAVVVLRDVVDMLHARLTVSTREGEVLSVRYNGSARRNIGRLVDALRDAGTGAPASAVGRALQEAAAERTAVPPDAVVGKDDLALLSDLDDLTRANPHLVPWAAHGRQGLVHGGRGPRGVLRRVRDLLAPPTVHGAVLAADATALEVVARHDSLVRGRTPVHSTSRTVLLWRAPDVLEVAPHPVYEHAVVVRLAAGAAAWELVVPAGSAAHALAGDAVQRLAAARR